MNNGLRMFALPRRSAPVVELQFWVRVGSADERKGEHGLAHFHEHTLFKGTETRSAEEIAGAVEGAGGVMNAFTSFDATCYHATLPENAWKTGLAVLADMVSNPRFDEAELEREIQVVREEIRRAQDEAESLRADALFATRYREHPYGRPILGTPESVGAFTREKVQGFYRRWYTPANTALVAVGDFDPEALFECAEAALERPAQAACERSRPAEPAQSAPRITLVQHPFECASFDISWPGPAFTHEDAPLLDLLAFILSGAESARLVRRVQNELGLAERTCADCFAPADPGVFGVSVDCSAEALPRALEAVVQETERLRRAPVSAAELDTARTNFLAMRAFECEGQAGRAQILGVGWALADDPHDEERTLARVRDARPEELLRVAQEWLKPGGINIAALPGQGGSAAAAITEETLHGAVERGLRRAHEARPKPEARDAQDVYARGAERAHGAGAGATAHNGAGVNAGAGAAGAGADADARPAKRAHNGADAGTGATAHNGAGVNAGAGTAGSGADADARPAERAHNGAGANAGAGTAGAGAGAGAAGAGANADAGATAHNGAGANAGARSAERAHNGAGENAGAHNADADADARPAKLAHPEVLAHSAGDELRLYQAESGLRIFTLRRKDAPLVSVRCVLPGGQRLETSPQQAGLSAFLAALWMRGTRRRDKADFDVRADALAATLDGVAERSHSGISLDCTADKLSPALELFSEALCEPAFDAEEIESERRETLAELARRKDRPGAHVFDLFRRVHYAPHPYRYPLYGTPETVARFDRDALEAQQARLVRARSLVLVLVGDIDPASAAQETAQRFAGLDAGEPKPVPPTPAAAPAEAREVVETRNCAQAHFVLGFRGLETGDADGPAADLLAQLLAGQAGRLFVEVRERQGLAYAVNAVNVEDPVQGVFLVNLGCAPEKLERAQDAVRGELLRILDTPPSARELESAQNNLVGSHAIDMQHNAFYAACIAADSLHGRSPTDLLEYPERVRDVGREDMLRVARRVLRLECATQAVIRP